MYLHTADYSMKKPCGIYELKNIQSILRRKIAYDIMLAGKKELKCFITKKAKALEVAASRAFFIFHFLLQWTKNQQVRAALFAI